MAHIFLRSKELRLAEWKDIDLEKGIWIIPAEHMKKRREYIVPLSRQVKRMLTELHDWTGDGKYVFASSWAKGKVITDATFLLALRRLGYSQDEMPLHGFRGIASTLLNELGYHRDIIEVQLAHVDRDRVRSTYNQAQWLEKRKEMMRGWSDYLDKLQAEAPNARPLLAVS